MIPVGDFNFVVCGFATLAATVGYAYTRKARPLPSRVLSQQNTLEDQSIVQSSSSKVDPEKAMNEADDDNALPEPAPVPSPNMVLETPVPDPDYDAESIIIPEVSIENSSLKRKRTHEEVDPEMAYPNVRFLASTGRTTALAPLTIHQNLKSIYPPSKRRGSISDEEPTEVATEIVVVERCNSPTEEQPPVVATADPVPNPDSPVKENVAPPKPEQPIFAELPRFAFPKTPPRVTPHFPFTRSTTASPGFANFAAGSSSPFFSPSPFSAAKQPIWASTTTNEGDSNSNVKVGDDDSAALAPAKTPSSSSSPLAVHIQTPPTGEEDEDVTLELKGAKLYIKRGEDAPFSGGMPGHLKLLSHKTAPFAKRLLFRREPLWKVSMNVRLQPTVRCTFDAQENVLRVALKELPVEDKWETGTGAGAAMGMPAAQTVIYAFKPGRSCRKSDFQDFAEALVAQAREGGQL
ncbi:hypothetical protein C8R46DRAFT_1348226 [Mycena filopes]|nr:hypothetical protein C8R46DRAFT_1348226 [Mycena filopes]